MRLEQGTSGLERRIAERVDVRVEVRWKRLSTSQSDSLLTKGGYSELFAFDDLNASTNQDVIERQAYTQNLSVTGLRLVGDLRMKDGSSLSEGWELLVEIMVPKQGTPIRALAVVVWVAPPGPGPRDAGLFFKAINKEDVERLTRLQGEAKQSPSPGSALDPEPGIA